MLVFLPTQPVSVTKHIFFGVYLNRCNDNFISRRAVSQKVGAGIRFYQVQGQGGLEFEREKLILRLAKSKLSPGNTF